MQKEGGLPVLRAVVRILLVLAAAALGGRLVDASLLIVLIVAHELAHLAVAAAVGCGPRGFSLSPAGMSIQLAPGLAAIPAAEIMVAAAGPLHHLIVLGLARLSAPFVAALGPHWPFFVRANLSLAIFNLIPAFPLDGGRILRAALSYRLDSARATRMVTALGKYLALALAAAGSYLLVRGRGPLLLLSGLYLLYHAPRGQEYLLAGRFRLLARKRRLLAKGRVLAGQCLIVREGVEIWPIVERRGGRQYLLFCLLDKYGHHQGWLTEELAIEAVMRRGLKAVFTAARPEEGREGNGPDLSNQEHENATPSGDWI